jgi:hypothetical protein
VANDSEEARVRAEAKFKKQQETAREGAKARGEYDTKVQKVRERTERLRAERAAREAAAANVPAEPVAKKSTRTKKAKTIPGGKLSAANDV